MNREKINQIPQQVKNGVLSIKEASDIIWVDIFKNPHSYGISNFDEDQKSEFLLYISPRFSKIIKKYSHGSISFFFYLRGFVKFAAGSFIRKSLKKYAADSCSADLLELTVAEENENCITTNSESDTSISFDALQKSYRVTPKRASILKKYIHILACRECNTLDEETSDKIANFLKIESEEFKNQLEKFKKQTEKKLRARQTIIERRNRAYFYRKKFLFELSHLDPESKMYKVVKERLTSQTNTWKNTNKLLKTHCSIAPSNEQIASLLKIRSRQVSFYLNRYEYWRKIFPFINFPTLQNGKETN